ncbi:MAG: hypothetical protein HOV81_21980 [Kofleriaceae bacterium]|nr:hypothetical protein [Kofleriaceae bacterium]
MKRFAIAILLVAACSGRGKKDTTPAGAGSGSGVAVYGKKIVVHWGIEQSASSAEVFLQTTDETGKQTSYPVGTYEGTCEAIYPAPEMKAVNGVRCKNGPKGVELHAVTTREDIIVVKLNTDEGVTPDPMAREEVTRVKVPTGIAVEAG